MDNAAVDRASLGIHESLVITKVPDGAAGAVLGKALAGAGALPVAGVYECEFRCDGLSKLEIRLNATFASGSSTTTGGTKYTDRSTTLQNFAGIGAMTSTVEQALTIATLKGEKYAKLTITTVGVLVSFTVAEVLGS